jgi:hypothetical protein
MTSNAIPVMVLALSASLCAADDAFWSTGDLGLNVIEDAGTFKVVAVLDGPSNEDPASMTVKYGLWNSPDVPVDVYLNDEYVGGFVADMGYITPGPEYATFDVTGLLVDGDNTIVCTGHDVNEGDYVIGQIDIEYSTGGCAADFNGDGALNILDFVAFQGAFVQMDPAADCDGNGLFNILDFVCYQALFQEGCP